jgi:putative phosphoribosyl transferase
MKASLEIPGKTFKSAVRITTRDAQLQGDLELPADAAGFVVFAHGSGSSRHSPRNKFVAEIIRKANIGTLLLDLLTEDEEICDSDTGSYRFDIALLAARLIETTRWLAKQSVTRALKVGYFGASTGGGAALVAAAELGDKIAAVVSRGGRPDLAGNALPKVKSPTLLIVGGYDEMVISLNEDAFAKLRCEKQFRIVPRATHLFEEPGALDQVAQLSAGWFSKYMGGGT